MERQIVVEDFIAVGSAMVYFVLEKPKQQMITNWVTACCALRPLHKKNPITYTSGERRVMQQPLLALLIPVFHRLPNQVAEVWIIIECRLSWVIS
ncbi:hypothetical protein ACFX2I_035821 [Malus domestica]